jgi:hypothetical protein
MAEAFDKQKSAASRKSESMTSATIICSSLSKTKRFQAISASGLVIVPLRQSNAMADAVSV